MAQCEGDWEQFCENVVDKLNAEYAELLKEKLAFEEMVKKDRYRKCMKYIPMYRKYLFEDCQKSYGYDDFSEYWRCNPAYEDTQVNLLKCIKDHLHFSDGDESLYRGTRKGKCYYKPITFGEESQWEVMMEGEDDVDSEGESLDDY